MVLAPASPTGERLDAFHGCAGNAPPLTIVIHWIVECGSEHQLFAEELGGQVLGNKLYGRISSEPHLCVRDIFSEWTARYVHTKRVRDELVLTRAMEELIGDTDPSFAYARGWDAVHGNYEGISLAKSATFNLSGDGLLVRRDIADPLHRAPDRPGSSRDGHRSGGIAAQKPD